MREREKGGGGGEGKEGERREHWHTKIFVAEIRIIDDTADILKQPQTSTLATHRNTLGHKYALFFQRKCVGAALDGRLQETNIVLREGLHQPRGDSGVYMYGSSVVERSV